MEGKKKKLCAFCFFKDGVLSEGFPDLIWLMHMMTWSILLMVNKQPGNKLSWGSLSKEFKIWELQSHIFRNQKLNLLFQKSELTQPRRQICKHKGIAHYWCKDITHSVRFYLKWNLSVLSQKDKIFAYDILNLTLNFSPESPVLSCFLLNSEV